MGEQQREPSSEVVFYVNGSRIALQDPDPALLLVDYLRSSGLTGTKLSCGEGGCGACTVMLARWDAGGRRVVRRSVNSCLRPVASIDGMAVTTVEGIGNSRDGLHPLQDRLAKGNGSQCGYCSPGFVMTAYSYLREHEQPSERELEDAFAGNLCRCTGYRPILDVMRSFATTPPLGGVAADEFPAELRDWPVRPLRLQGGGKTWYRATTLEEAQRLEASHYVAPNDPKLVAGNTSIGIYKANVDDPRVLIDIAAVAELQRLVTRDDQPALEVGGAVTYTSLIEYLVAGDAPEGTDQAALLGVLKQIAGTQVRDEATVGGAISLIWQHAESPRPFASDLYTALAGLDATVTLASAAYDGGRQAFGALELPPPADWPHDAIVATVSVPVGDETERVETYRVARREQNAHALVNACLRVTLDGDGVVQTARLAFGGIAGLPVRAAKTEQALVGQRWDGAALAAALDALHDELGPVIRDPRDGISTRYRLELAESLFYRFYLRVAEALAPGSVGSRLAGGAEATPRPISSGVEDIQTENAVPKLTGGAADRRRGALHGRHRHAGAHAARGARLEHPRPRGLRVPRRPSRRPARLARALPRRRPATSQKPTCPARVRWHRQGRPGAVNGAATAYGQLIGIVVAEQERVALAAAACVQHELVDWTRRPPVLGIAGARRETARRCCRTRRRTSSG